jgi:hypothetical protein
MKKITFLILLIGLISATGFTQVNPPLVIGDNQCEGGNLIVQVIPQPTRANTTFGLYLYNGSTHTRVDWASSSIHTVTFASQTTVGEYQVWSFDATIVPAPLNDPAGNGGTHLNGSPKYIFPTPEVDEVELQASNGTVGPPWYDVTGDLANGFSLCIDPDLSTPTVSYYYYLDVKNLTMEGIPHPGSNPMEPELVNGFYLDTSSLPTGWTTYWNDKGVNASATSPAWQYFMYRIITEVDPIFYLYKTTGGDVQLIDGLQYNMALALTGTGVLETLRVNSDYPEHNYSYDGTVEDTAGCVSDEFTVMIEFNHLPVPTIGGWDDVCAGSTETYTTEGGNSSYVWNVTGGTIVSGAGTFQIQIEWDNPAPANAEVSVSYTDGTTGCTSATATVLTVTVNSLPVPTISGETNPCANTTHTYTTEAGQSGYIWNIVNGTGTSTTNTIDVTWDNTTGPGSVTVTYTDGNGCTGTSAAYGVTIDGVAQIVGGDIYCTIQDAIDNATAGQTVILLDDVSEGKVTVNKAITLDGDDYTLTSTSANWGISITSPDVNILDITVSGAGTFGIHQSPSCGNLDITNTTVTAGGGTGFALNCSDGIDLTDITSTNNGGNGVSITDCHNVTITNITTSGNTFGSFGAGIGIFSSGGYCTAGCSNIVINDVNNISEVPKVYEEISAGTITGLSLPASLTHFAGIAAASKFYAGDLNTAYAMAAEFIYDGSINPGWVHVEEIATGNKYVEDDIVVMSAFPTTVDMLIQAAIDYASPGTLILVQDGEYSENITVDKELTLQGGGSGRALTTITGATPNVDVIQVTAGGSSASAACWASASAPSTWRCRPSPARCWANRSRSCRSPSSSGRPRPRASSQPWRPD